MENHSTAFNDRRSGDNYRFLQQVQDAQAITLDGGNQSISLLGLKAALLFIDAQQKRVGSETAWIEKGNDPPLSVPPAPPLKGVAIVNPTPTPLSQEERNDLLDYGNWRMNGLRCSLDPLRREVSVTALTDDKALLMIGCEAGAYNTVDWRGLFHGKSRSPPARYACVYPSITVSKTMNWN